LREATGREPLPAAIVTASDGVTGTTQKCHPTVTMRRYGLSRVPQGRPDIFPNRSRLK
jgi:hypothetical protein